MTLELFHYWRSSCSWRVRWSLEYKNIKFKSNMINLLNGEQKSDNFLKLNPSGFVPCIKTDNGVLNESLAILEWIEETYPRPALLPHNPFDRAQIRSLCLLIVAGTQPLQNLGVLHYYSNEVDKQQEHARHWIRKGLSSFENQLKNIKRSGQFCFEDQLTLADLCLIPQCYNAQRFNLCLDEFPLIQKIQQNALATPSCKAAHPDQYQAQK